MIHLFQIGDAAIHLHQQSQPDWDVVGTGKATEMLRSPAVYWPNRQYLPDVRKITINAMVLPEGGMTVRQQIEKLKRLVDMPTTVIAYELSGCEDEAPGCGCESDGSCQLTWLSNHGVLKSISESAPVNGTQEISISIEVGSYWAPLNRYLWQWQTSDFDPLYPPLEITPYSKFIKAYPDCSVLTNYMPSAHWSRRPGVSRIAAYDPDLWMLLLQDTGLNFPIGQGADFGGFSHGVYNNPYEWSAPPLSIYAFTDLPDNGSVRISVKHTYGLSQTATDFTDFDLGQTDAALTAAGLTGLLTTDIVYMGDVYPKPGFIVRAGAVLPVYPVITYPGLWPGQLDSGTNFVSFSLPDGGTQIAYVHFFRKL